MDNRNYEVVRTFTEGLYGCNMPPSILVRNQQLELNASAKESLMISHATDSLIACKTLVS